MHLSSMVSSAPTNGTNALFFCGRVQAGRAINSVAIAQRERRKTQAVRRRRPGLPDWRRRAES